VFQTIAECAAPLNVGAVAGGGGAGSVTQQMASLGLQTGGGPFLVSAAGRNQVSIWDVSRAACVLHLCATQRGYMSDMTQVHLSYMCCLHSLLVLFMCDSYHISYIVCPTSAPHDDEEEDEKEEEEEEEEEEERVQ